MKDQDIGLPEHDCLYEGTNDQGYIDLEPAYRKSTVLMLIEADRQRRGEPVELQGVSEALSNGDGFWRSCSGCHETNEGYDTGPYSKTLRCHLGNGCRECGGIGAVWDDTDYDAMADYMARGMGYQQPAEPVKVPSDEEIDAVFNGMPDGGNGWLKSWGYRQFARALLARFGQPAQPAASAEPWDGHKFKRHADGTWRCADGCGPVLVERRAVMNWPDGTPRDERDIAKGDV